MTMFSKMKDAKSAYLSAIKIDDTNQNCLRDLATVQLHIKDWTGLAESKRKYMLVSPQVVNFCSYLWALYMAEDYDTALQCLDSTLEIVFKDEKSEKYQAGELYLF